MKKLLYMFVFFVMGSVFGQDFSSSINTYLNSNKSELRLQSQDIEDKGIKLLEDMDGIVVPGGFGDRPTNPLSL